MIDVAIDLNLHYEGPSDCLSTRLYVYNWKIYPLAAGGTIIIATFPKHYTLLPTTSPDHRRILLEASPLCSALNNYGNFDVFYTPTIL